MKCFLVLVTVSTLFFSTYTVAKSASSFRSNLTLLTNLNSSNGPLSGQLQCESEEDNPQNCNEEAARNFIGWCNGISSKTNASSLTLDEIQSELKQLINQQKSDCLKKTMSEKSAQLAFFIQQRGKISKRKTCGEFAATKENLKSEILSDAVWGETLEKTYSEQIKDFREALVYPKSFNKFEFIACAHTATFSEEDRMISTNKKLLSYLEKQSPQIIEVERADSELGCDMAGPTLFKSEEEILLRGEHEVAIWYALQNLKTLRGGEPEEDDFLKMIPMVSTSTVADYYNYKVHRCLSQLDMTEKIKYPTWELAYTHCQLGIPEKFQLKDDKEYRQWFMGKSNLKPAAFRRINCKETYKSNEGLMSECLQGSSLSLDPKDLYQHPYFELLSTPVDGADEGSMAYYSSTLGHIKNFCLRKNLQEAKEEGSTAVIYGGGHLFENFHLLEKLAK